MFIKDKRRNGKIQLDRENKDIAKQQKDITYGTVSCVVGMLFMFIFIMSLMIVKVSSTATYQNQTSAIVRTRSIKSYNNPVITTDNVTTTETIETTSIRQRKLTKLPVPNRTAISTQKLSKARRNSWKPTKHKEKKMRADTQQQARERLQMHQLHQQQQYQQQQHEHQHQQKQKQQRQQNHLPHLPKQKSSQQEKSHGTSGEKAYLVEHAADDESAHEQPIYGTWRTKARRPQAPLITQQLTPATISAENVTTANSTDPTLPPAPTPTALAASTTLTAEDEDPSPNNYQEYHVYERLPKRSSTMTPIRNELHDQIPRPPRLTSRRPSVVLRRQYLETPMNTSYRGYEQNPKPFHFPFEGPLPEEFKKVEPERSEVNNIQDILQQLQLSSTPTRAAQLVMMPTGLHIAGSYKNLKASGIANFFRNKRHKKPVQLTFPLPMPMSLPMQFYGAFPPPMHGTLHQPYQRIAMDQIYPFKPRSPNEINLLAMQQQLNANRTKNKKKKNAIGLNSSIYGYNNSLYMQQSNQRPEHYIPHYPPQWLAVNASQKPKFRRIPFKLNLDIYPMLPPAKEHIPIPVRAPIGLSSPYVDYSAFRYPLAPPNAVYPYMQTQFNEQPLLYNAVRFRTPAPVPAQVPQSSNMKFSFPEHVPKYSQQLAQHQHQQKYQRPPLDPQQNSFVPIDCMESSGTGTSDDSFNPSSNQIMVHLNVFPKQQLPTSTQLPSTNPFYNMQNRNTIPDSPDSPIRIVEPRHFPRPIQNENITQQQVQSSGNEIQQRIARSDGGYPTSVDFENPIVAADAADLPQPTTFISNKLDTSGIAPQYDHIGARNNFHYDSDANLEQAASEAKTASLFRFPVEDLIQFQVGDAL